MNILTQRLRPVYVSDERDAVVCAEDLCELYQQ